MSTYVMIHGAGDTGWYWHLVTPLLRAHGHDVVTPTLPGGPVGLTEYADTVVEAVGSRTGEFVVVAQSFGGFTAPLVVDRLGASALVFVAGMVPKAGESPDGWWTGTGYPGPSGDDDLFFHDVPAELAAEAEKRPGAHSTTSFDEPCAPLPDVPTRYVLGLRDRFFQPSFTRRMVAERLGIEPEEIDAGHCVALARPKELAELLLG
ncbi:alpha/beta fold hydrolase [Labedaea rhizosphaerae]|nr:alpha/beta hydrolase [Labedaea rhizosphaerae]